MVRGGEPRQSTRPSSSSAVAYGPPSARSVGTAPSVAAAASPTGGRLTGRAKLMMGTALVSWVTVAAGGSVGGGGRAVRLRRKARRERREERAQAAAVDGRDGQAGAGRPARSG